VKRSTLQDAKENRGGGVTVGDLGRFCSDSSTRFCARFPRFVQNREMAAIRICHQNKGGGTIQRESRDGSDSRNTLLAHPCLFGVPPTLAYTRPRPVASPLVRQPAHGARGDTTAANMLGLRSLEVSPVSKRPLVRRGSDEASSAHMLASSGAVAPRGVHSASAALRRTPCPADSVVTRVAC
jgi:hypothetical protein